MQAYAIKTLNDQAVVEIVERAEWALGPTQMRIQMHAASLNRGEFIVGHGLHGKSDVPQPVGLEGAGTVLEIVAAITMIERRLCMIFFIGLTLISTDDRRLSCGWRCFCGVDRTFGGMSCSAAFVCLVQHVPKSTHAPPHDTACNTSSSSIRLRDYCIHIGRCKNRYSPMETALLRLANRLAQHRVRKKSSLSYVPPRSSQSQEDPCAQDIPSPSYRGQITGL